MRELIARGADIETRGDHDRTPLIAATKNRAAAAAQALIDAGADVNAKDDLEDSAYLYAGRRGPRRDPRDDAAQRRRPAQREPLQGNGPDPGE
ncbi:hypothetical protein [Nocardia sp. NBC_00403]|uniref:hypothetical protein n=1 Tax=Nocardia sp. NBC_00403 TaxID=2975990 RepID=UPI002E229041